MFIPSLEIKELYFFISGFLVAKKNNNIMEEVDILFDKEFNNWLIKKLNHKNKNSILTANAMLYYTEDDLTIDKNKLFNGMHYIGKYDWTIIIKDDSDTKNNTLGDDFWDAILG